MILLDIIIQQINDAPAHHIQVEISDAILSWSSLKKIVNDNVPPKYDLATLIFSYTDEEGDDITGTTEIEWNSYQHQSMRLKQSFNVNIYPVLESTASMNSNEDNKICNRNENQTNYMRLNEQQSINKFNEAEICTSFDEMLHMNSKEEGKCCKGQKSCCATESADRSSDSALCMMNETEDTHEELLEKIINPTLHQYTYTGKSLQAVALPLGALGGGSIAIAGDGGLRQWQILNKVNHVAHVPDSFFAIRMKDKTQDIAKILQCDALYNTTGFQPSPYVSDHVVPRSSIELLKKIPGVSELTITAKFPVVEVNYNVNEALDVRLEAWSPKIPLNSKDSGLPVIIFDFHVTNKTDDVIEVSLLSSQQNLVGWNGQDQIDNDVKCSGYGGNVNSLLTSKSTFGITMSNQSLAANHPFYGNLSVITINDDISTPSVLLQYTNVESLWKEFTSCGLSGQGIPGESKPGTTFNGALVNSKQIAGKRKMIFTFILGWFFPNRYRDWNFGVGIPQTDIYVGNYYSKLWKSIKEVMEYAVVNLENLRTSTYDFRDQMFNSTVPWQLIDSAAGRVSVLNSPTCMWHADGYFYAFEGCSPSSGCCPLNCTHVWNYEMALALLFPDLERTMREIDLLKNMTPHGVIPSRTTCPLELSRQWTSWKDFSINEASCLICVDGEIGTVLKTYREILHGASRDWFNTLWPRVKMVMNHWLNVLDDKKNGLIYGPQPNTFDRVCYGYIPIFGCLYLCGLRAAEEMAKLQNDEDFAKICADRFALGSKNLDSVCFTNGKWYTHVPDPNHMTNVLSSCTLVGALYGQWWAHYLNLGYLLPEEHIKSHLKYTYKRNYVDSYTKDIKQIPRRFCDARDSGWTIGVWDKGEQPLNPLRYSSEASWSGIIYPFAALLLYEGFQDEGLKVLEVTRYLYDGTRRSPWNEIECGDHYSRSMSGFSLFKFANGLSWSFDESGAIHLSFNPTMKQQEFKSFFILNSCWGSYEQNYESCKIIVSYGKLSLASFTLPSTLSNKSRLGMVDVKIQHRLTLKSNNSANEEILLISRKVMNSKLVDGLVLKFEEPLNINADQVFCVTLG